MKHPALARVFSVVVTILGLLLLLYGIRGFGKADSEHADRLAYEKKTSGRIENYETLRAEYLNSADYQETMDALKRFLDEHEKAAAKHKTDTALYSATKGGLKMGEDMIVTIRAQMNEIKEQLRNAASRKAFLEGLLTELIASQKSNLPWLEALSAQAAQYAVESYSQGAKVKLVSSEFRALMEDEPTPASVAAALYTPPEPPSVPMLPLLPDMAGTPVDMMQAAYGAAMDSFLGAAADYEQAMTDYAQNLQDSYNASAQQFMDQFSGGYSDVADVLTDAAASAEYKLAHKLWEEECEMVKGQLDLHEARRYIPRLSSALAALIRQGDSYFASVTLETGGIYPAIAELMAMADSTGARIDARLDTDLKSLPNAEFLALTDEIEQLFDMITDGFIVVAQNLDNPASLIAELMERLHITEALVELLEPMLEKAEQQMQAALEELWYQMGEAEKDALKLEAEKLGLDKEAVLLSKRTLDADALKDLRSRCISSRQLLMNIPEVRAMTEDESELAENARSWLGTYAQETERLYQGKRLINILAIISGVMAVLGIPAAFELLKSRFFLIVPVLLCMVSAAGAEALNLYLGEGQHYFGLFTAIFAFIQLLIVLPRVKKPGYIPQH